MGIVIYFIACGIILPILIICGLVWFVHWLDNVADEHERLMEETDEFIRSIKDER